MKDLLQDTKDAIAEYENALTSLDRLELAGGYVVRFRKVCLTFDATDDGLHVFNARPCKPHLARSFSWAQAKSIASLLHSQDCERGEVVHVRQAVHELLDSHQAVLQTLEAFARGHDPVLYEKGPT
jgi:hypothetical protein